MEPLDSDSCNCITLGVVLLFDLAEFGVSWFWVNRALLGVDLLIVGLRPSTVIGGTTISEGVMASCQGLLEVSSRAICFPVLLALLLSRILIGSPRTASLLGKPEDPGTDMNSAAAEVDAPVCNGGSVGLSDGSLLGLSTQPAGVGGIGPKLDMA